MSIESVVSAVIQRVGVLLYEEIKFLTDVEGEVNNLSMELKAMQSYLKDAEARQENFDQVDRIKVGEIIKIAYDAEDVIESFILNSMYCSMRKGSLFQKYFFFCCSLVHIHQIGKEVVAIEKRIQVTTAMFERYGVRQQNLPDNTIGTSSTSMISRPRAYPHSDVDEHVVGLHKHIENMVDRLTGKHGLLSILVIAGMGGLGKTTLARKIYNHESVKSYFKHRAWVCISQTWDASKILSEISRQIGSSNVESLNLDKLVLEVHAFLEDELCLIVLDDVWQKEVLEQILPAFPLGNERIQSKIIVTTRKREVAQFPNLHPYTFEPPRLDEDQSWDLFCKIAFADNNLPHFGDFDTLGKEMLRKCDGLPLAIIALGGILNTKTSRDEWERVHAAVSSKMIAEGRGTLEYGSVRAMLELSYSDLPYQLKPCFLYLGLYLEDEVIKTGELMRMWIAEGFITCDVRSGETWEDTARQYLNELVQRCFFQVTRNDYRGNIKECRIHDLMRDLCILKGKEVDFLKVLPVDNTTSTQGAIVRESCRLAMHEGLQLTTHNSHLRSFVYWTGSSNFDTRPVCENFRFLRVLRIEHYIISELPEALGDLIFLRYLNVSSTKVPRSLGNLHRLLIVDFRGVLSHAELPDVLMKLEQLQYLYLSPPFGVPAAASQLRLPTSGNLQTLWGISAKSWRVKDLEQLSHLRKLFVTDIASMEELESVWKCPSITSDRVHKLGLEVEDEMELSSLGPISHSHNLSSLYLRGSLRQLPIDYGGFPRNLTKLILKDSKLSQDPMPFLGSNLPYLKYLHLGWDAYTGSEMVCKENSFLALEKLELFGLPNLRSLKVENGALPQLKYFEISDGVQIPQRLASLGT